MNIYIASDHAGFELKKHLSDFLGGLGLTVIDKGPFSLDESDDYPDYMRLVAEDMLRERDSAKGIIIGMSGQGEAMAVNRYRGIRASVYYGGPLDVIRLSREHNDSNVLSLGAKFLTNEDVEIAVKLWLETKFSGAERHKRRIDKLDI